MSGLKVVRQLPSSDTELPWPWPARSRSAQSYPWSAQGCPPSSDRRLPGMVRAIKDSWAWHSPSMSDDGGIKIGTDFKDMNNANGIVDLGNGLCFRREAG